MYGAKGISVCDDWKKFENFLTDMGERPPGKTLDRKNGKLGYSKENCQWATPQVQQHNISSNVNLTFDGKTQCLSAWARELGMTPSALKFRIDSNWGDDAFKKPVGKYKRKPNL